MSSSSSIPRMLYPEKSIDNLKALYWVLYLKNLTIEKQLEWFQQTSSNHITNGDVRQHHMGK